MTGQPQETPRVVAYAGAAAGGAGAPEDGHAPVPDENISGEDPED